jgi:cytochrome c-type biogenesis protein
MKKFFFFSLIALILITSVAADTLEGLKLPPGVQKLKDYQQELALSITFLIAFLGGILSFTSPCGFVVLPAFFSYVFKERKRAMYMTATFSLGMTIAFILFGLVAGAVGDFFNLYKEFFASISGGLLIVFGIMMIFNKGFSVFDFKMKHKPNHGWGVFFLGFFFAIGWTPCVGPILGGMILLAADTANMIRGATLFGFYALGVALPLLLVSWLSDKYDISKWFQSKHIEFKFFGSKVYTHVYGIVGGIMLIIIGLIMFLMQGTRVFMDKIPQYISWNMTFFTHMNEALVESTFFTSGIAQVIGVVLGLLVIFSIYRGIRKPYKEHKKK